ncbi:MAG TPA: hypothetical protein VFM18_08340, partial [Methanosarcina sp.]|nr:hypothetical protein [Methanosarcina sp.]
MSKYKLSPWHDGSVKPVHVGVYETSPRGILQFYQYWNGRTWRVSSISIDGAFANRNDKSTL